MNLQDIFNKDQIKNLQIVKLKDNSAVASNIIRKNGSSDQANTSIDRTNISEKFRYLKKTPTKEEKSSPTAGSYLRKRSSIIKTSEIKDWQHPKKQLPTQKENRLFSIPQNQKPKEKKEKNPTEKKVRKPSVQREQNLNEKTDKKLSVHEEKKADVKKADVKKKKIRNISGFHKNMMMDYSPMSSILNFQKKPIEGTVSNESITENNEFDIYKKKEL